MEKFILQVHPIIDDAVGRLCLRPYSGHPKGCPNFNKKEGCPPRTILYDEKYDLSKPVYAIFNAFDLAGQVGRMRKKHPEWSQKQLASCRYWQRGTQAELARRIRIFEQQYADYQVETRPEAMGVNVTETMRQVGIQLEWPPETVAYQVALGACLQR